MSSRYDNILDQTDSLSPDELEELISKSLYVLGLTVISELEQDSFGLEGGDTWYFEEYETRVDRQFQPIEDQISWQGRRLSMPGTKELSESSQLKIGARYIAFYEYSAMARGYSLEGLMRWDDQKVAEIETLIAREQSSS